MGNPQEIIVYRNPVEAFWWHALMSGDAFVYLCYFGLAVGALTLVLWLHSKASRRNRIKW